MLYENGYIAGYGDCKEFSANTGTTPSLPRLLTGNQIPRGTQLSPTISTKKVIFASSPFAIQNQKVRESIRDFLGKNPIGKDFFRTDKMIPAQNTKGNGDYSVVTSSLVDQLLISSDKTRKLFTLETEDELWSVCNIICDFFDINVKKNAPIMKSELLGSQTVVIIANKPFTITRDRTGKALAIRYEIPKDVAALKQLIAKDDKTCAEIYEGIKAFQYDKQCRLPVEKRTPDPRVPVGLPYRMNLEIKDANITKTSDTNLYKTWAEWEVAKLAAVRASTIDPDDDNTLHRKYINIHLDLKKR